MGKLCDIKERLIDLMYDVVMSEDVHSVCAKELYEVMDIIKDIEETKYYMSITDAMDSAENPEEYVKKYIPEYTSRMYYQKEEKTIDSIMDDIDVVFAEMPKEHRSKMRQDLINFVSKITV